MKNALAFLFDAFKLPLVDGPPESAEDQQDQRQVAQDARDQQQDQRQSQLDSREDAAAGPSAGGSTAGPAPVTPPGPSRPTTGGEDLSTRV